MRDKIKENFLLYGEGSVLNKGCEAILSTTINKIQESCQGEIEIQKKKIHYTKRFKNLMDGLMI